MKRLPFAILVVTITACATLPRPSAPGAAARAELWNAAHMALYMEDFARADPYVTNGLVVRWRVRE
jgi:hypothetical protein